MNRAPPRRQEADAIAGTIGRVRRADPRAVGPPKRLSPITAAGAGGAVIDGQSETGLATAFVAEIGGAVMTGLDCSSWALVRCTMATTSVLVSSAIWLRPCIAFRVRPPRWSMPDNHQLYSSLSTARTAERRSVGPAGSV